MKKTGALKIFLGIAGAFAAAVGSGVIFSCAYSLLLIPADLKNSEAVISDGLLFVAASAVYLSSVVAFLTLTFLALTYVIISNRLQHSSRRYYLCSGVAIGPFVFILLEIWQHRLPGPPFRVDFDVLFFAISFMISGTTSAWAFWSIARPDKWQRHRVRWR